MKENKEKTPLSQSNAARSWEVLARGIHPNIAKLSNAPRSGGWSLFAHPGLLKKYQQAVDDLFAGVSSPQRRIDDEESSSDDDEAIPVKPQKWTLMSTGTLQDPNEHRDIAAMRQLSSEVRNLDGKDVSKSQDRKDVNIPVGQKTVASSLLGARLVGTEQEDSCLIAPGYGQVSDATQWEKSKDIKNSDSLEDVIKSRNSRPNDQGRERLVQESITVHALACTSLQEVQPAGASEHSAQVRPCIRAQGRQEQELTTNISSVEDSVLKQAWLTQEHDKVQTEESAEQDNLIGKSMPIEAIT